MGEKEEEIVLRHLMGNGELDSLMAISRYGINKLSPIIRQLSKNHIINVERLTGYNSEGDKITYAKYIYVGRKDENHESNELSERSH